MDGLDWSNQQDDLEDMPLMNIPGSDKMQMMSKDHHGFINPVHQIQTTHDAVFPNVLPQWNSRSEDNNTLNNINQQNGLILDSGLARSHDAMKKPVVSTTTAGSLESLDCLLSASNSQTDTTSVEDDGISMIFSDCKSLWTYKSVPSAVLRPEDNTKRLGKNSDTAVSHDNQSVQNHHHHHPTNSGKRKRAENPQHSHQNYNYSATTDHHQAVSSKNPQIRFIIKHQFPAAKLVGILLGRRQAIAQMKEMIYRAAAFRGERWRSRNARTCAYRTTPRLWLHGRGGRGSARGLGFCRSWCREGAKWTQHPCLMRLQTTLNSSDHR
ncbi:UNVERIFIED_CONTAM: Transcription factor [Sesamum latifolium]|uniref:Transcription factor n=1 Tax=Sesamum latifolium TaxID=2727402 RepID=A0AAW2UCU2_9LAMI